MTALDELMQQLVRRTRATDKVAAIDGDSTRAYKLVRSTLLVAEQHDDIVKTVSSGTRTAGSTMAQSLRREPASDFIRVTVVELGATRSELLSRMRPDIQQSVETRLGDMGSWIVLISPTRSSTPSLGPAM